MKQWTFSNHQFNITVRQNDRGQYELHREGVVTLYSTDPEGLLRRGYFEGYLLASHVRDLARVLGIPVPEFIS